MLTKEEIIRKIEENREKIRGFGVRKLALFGSYARNEGREGSDIDFLVEFVEGRGLFDDFVHLLHFLKDLFGKEIDLGEEHLLREELKPSVIEGEKVEAKL